MIRLRRARSALFAAVAIGGILTATPMAVGAALPPPPASPAFSPFFRDSAAPDAPQVESPATFRQRRFVAMDAPALWGGLVEAKLTASKVDLPIFADLRVTLPTTSLDVRPDGITWTGRSTNTTGPTQEAIITVDYPGRFRAGADAAVTGSVWFGNRKVTIVSLGDGAAVFTELDPAAMLHDAPGPVPATAAGTQPAADPKVTAADSQGPSAGFIDVMFLYTAAARAAQGGTDAAMTTWVNNALANANAANSTSGVGFQFRAVFTGYVGYTEPASIDTALRDLTNSVGAFGGVPSLRADYGADLVQLVGRRWSATACGIGWLPDTVQIGGANNAAQTVVDADPNCDQTASAHELGHNLALHHDHANLAPNETSSYPDAYGYRVNNSFATVMAYNTGCNCSNVARWSNPNVTFNGLPTGIATYANNGRVIAIGGPVASDFRHYPTPFGSLERIDRSVGAVVVTGWALDFDTTSPITVHIQIDGGATTATTANLSRPDVGAAYPGYGNNHGYQALVNISSGTHTICAYGINVGPGLVNGVLGCQVYNASGTPWGVYGTHDYPGGVRFDGWAVDPDTGAPVTIHGYVGTAATAATANLNRPDIAAIYPLAGPNHGFDNLIVPAANGTHQVCAYAINYPNSPGDNALLTPGCKTITLTGIPYGSYGATKTGTSVRVEGWALDPDIANPITVHIYVDPGQGPAVAVVANLNRPDIAAAFPGYGPNHGFDTTIGPLTPGPHQVCAYAINNNGNPAANALLNPGCITVTI